MKKIATSLILAAMLVIPSVSLAANPLFTPVTVIKNSLYRAFWEKPAHGANIRTAVDYTEKNLKNVVVERGAAEVIYDYDVRYGTTGKPSVRLSLNLPKLEMMEDGKTQSWNNPVGLEFLSLGTDATFVRITSLSPEAQTFLKENVNLDLAPIVGVWVKTPAEDEIEEYLENRSSALGNLTPNEEEYQAVKTWYQDTVKRVGSPVKITRLNRVTTNNAGEKVQTVRVSVNTAWYAALENFAIAEYKKENPKATAREIANQRKMFKEGMVEFKKVLSKLQTDLTLNLSTGVISNATFNYNAREAEYTYDYKYVNGTYKSTKKLKGYSTLNVKTVANFRPLSMIALELPGNSITVDEAEKLVVIKPEPLPEYDVKCLSDCSDDTFGLQPIDSNQDAM